MGVDGHLRCDQVDPVGLGETQVVFDSPYGGTWRRLPGPLAPRCHMPRQSWESVQPVRPLIGDLPRCHRAVEHGAREEAKALDRAHGRLAVGTEIGGETLIDASAYPR